MAQLENGFTISNTLLFTTSSNYANASVSFSHVDGIRIESDEPRTVDDFRHTEHRFRALVNLLGDCQIEIVSAKCGQALGEPIEIEYLDKSFFSHIGKREDAKRGRMPLSFGSLGEVFSHVLTRWFAEYERLEPVVSLYLFGKHNTFLDLGTMFLLVMQALEAYHRSFHQGVFVDQTSYDATVRQTLNAAIPSNLNAEFQQRLRSAIQYGFEYSLRRRLRELVDVLPQSSLFAEARAADFRNRTVDTRNTMTHQIPNPTFPPLEGADLYNAIQTCREVLFALILRRLGINDDTIIAATERLSQTRGSLVVYYVSGRIKVHHSGSNQNAPPWTVVF